MYEYTLKIDFHTKTVNYNLILSDYKRINTVIRMHEDAVYNLWY